MKNTTKSHSERLKMVEVDHKKIAVEIMNGNVHVNLTHLARKFNKRPADWLRTEESKSYLEALSVTQMCVLADLVKVRNGGVPGNNGTWAMDYRIAMRFAQWLSPEFSIAVDEMLVKLMRGDAVLAEPIGGVWPIIQNGVVGYPRKEILEAAGLSYNSGTVSHWKKKFPHEHYAVCRVACLSPKMAKFRYESGQVRQLRLSFDEKGGRS